ncbi:hypothetical protein NPIL_143851 [Nephila pilipes]|uniref:Uncharacterized protein n=1 Tax=Nephila pilipes TaxID=299642 RepID=A0A8X6MPH9_NEPPI|nr:hypothetical protein NPIL_143851 [Nephila pilipes]
MWPLRLLHWFPKADKRLVSSATPTRKRAREEEFDAVFVNFRAELNKDHFIEFWLTTHSTFMAEIMLQSTPNIFCQTTILVSVCAALSLPKTNASSLQLPLHIEPSDCSHLCHIFNTLNKRLNLLAIEDCIQKSSGLPLLY